MYIILDILIWEEISVQHFFDGYGLVVRFSRTVCGFAYMLCMVVYNNYYT